MKREPTAEEGEKIGRATATGDRIEATSIYISLTECRLTEVPEFIKALTTELQSENPEKFAKKLSSWFPYLQASMDLAIVESDAEVREGA